MRLVMQEGDNPHDPSFEKIHFKVSHLLRMEGISLDFRPSEHPPDG